MSKYEYKTEIGGRDIHFPQTAWTNMLNPALREKMLAELSLRYWKPLYFFLRGGKGMITNRPRN